MPTAGTGRKMRVVLDKIVKESNRKGLWIVRNFTFQGQIEEKRGLAEISKNLTNELAVGDKKS